MGQPEGRGAQGRTKPIPRCMVFQLSDLALNSATPFQRTRRQNKGRRRKGVWWLSRERPLCRSALSAPLLCLQCLITRCSCSQKHPPLTFFFFFLLTSTLPFILPTPVAGKLPGRLGKPSSWGNGCAPQTPKEERRAQPRGESLSPSCHNGFLFHTQSFIFATKCYFHLVLYVLMLYVLLFIYLVRFYIPFHNLMPKCSCRYSVKLH